MYICVFTSIRICASKRNNLFQILKNFDFFKWGFTPCKAEEPLGPIELQEKKNRKIKSKWEGYLERTQK